MASTPQRQSSSVQPKAKYHHGDLREALISAVYQLVSEQGAENLSLADACRAAGVSTAAPYRHFQDRDEILAEVTARGLHALREGAEEAIGKHGPGTMDAMIAMSQAYVAFALAQPGLFRLIFGQNPALAETELVSKTAVDCFGYVIERVAKFCRAEGRADDATEIAVRIWTFVHGAASLLIDGKYDMVAPETHVEKLIAAVIPGLLAQSTTAPKRA